MNTVLITGANRGLGFEFTKQYANDGWKVIACCRHPEQADELQALAAENSAVIVERLDVNDFAQIDELGEKYRGQPIDVLLNNAGVIGPFPIDDNIKRQHFGSMEYDVWADVLRTNTFAPVKMAEPKASSLAIISTSMPFATLAFAGLAGEKSELGSFAISAFSLASIASL